MGFSVLGVDLVSCAEASKIGCCAPPPMGTFRGSRDGWNRARLAFVGERKFARFGVVSRLVGLAGNWSRIASVVSIGSEAVGDVFRRFLGYESISQFQCMKTIPANNTGQ